MSGREALSIELTAVIGADAADALAEATPAPLTLWRDADGSAEASILVIDMQGLGVEGGRWLPRFDYREVLYRVGVELDGARGWLALRCDLDRALVRAMARSVIRYPVAPATIEIDDRDASSLRVVSTGSGATLSARLDASASGPGPAPVSPRRTLVLASGRVFEVPWAERPAPLRVSARVIEADAGACNDVFGGPITLDAAAVVHRGRGHSCGAARPL